ncbi:MAG: hypothetical protein WAT39_02360 [Planctomycetota bacterium]
MNAKTTRKERGSDARGRGAAKLAREYRFDYRRSRANRFARTLRKNTVVVVLDPDVAEVIRDARRVNSLLRAAIAALRKGRPRRAG